MNVLEKLAAINRQLLGEKSMNKVLESLMAAALEISGAENGFLVVKTGEGEDEADDAILPGYRLAVAKNIAMDDLAGAEHAPSLSAVQEAMSTAEPVMTDNALTDPRFERSKSVKQQHLKSILALPIITSEGVLGVFYLDHRFQMGVFEGDTLSAMKAFADQAALALEKARMIEQLKTANEHLQVEVEEESGRRHELERELAMSRLELKHEYREIVGCSPAMLSVLALVDKITDSNVAVWIYGESGTGKEAIARALHFNSSRARYPFASENCGALPENLLESELFGHKRGAFTHADRDKKGRFEHANKGTVFLDEIADMSPNLQMKLLRFLQEGEVRPVGSNEIIKVDVRVVSASNKDLAQLVEQGRFREDLFYRLNGIMVTLPPLRERVEDIPLLCDHFLKKTAERDQAEELTLAPDSLRLLMNYSWPGNIRELQNAIQTASLFAEKGKITPKSFEFKPVLLTKKRVGVVAPNKTTARIAMPPDLEKVLLAIKEQGYHKGNAARALGMSRRNLYVKLAKYKIPPELKELKAYIDERFI